MVDVQCPDWSSLANQIAEKGNQKWLPFSFFVLAAALAAMSIDCFVYSRPHSFRFSR